MLAVIRLAPVRRLVALDLPSMARIGAEKEACNEAVALFQSFQQSPS